MAADDWPTWLIALGGGAIPTLAAASILAANVFVADRRLARWAASTGRVILWRQRRWARCGPYKAAMWGGKIVYRLRSHAAGDAAELGWATSKTGLYAGRQPVDYQPDRPDGFPVVPVNAG